MFEPWMCAFLALPFITPRPALFGERLASGRGARSCAHQHTMELRVDVQWSAASVDDELKSLHARLERSGLLKGGTNIISTQLKGLVLRHREADGEHYIYVEDVARGCLAGYTVFNRLVEVNRSLDRFVRAPHSKYAIGYQRMGVATAVYEWALAQGFCLVSGARQSQSAHALWISLASRHRLEYIEVRNKCIHLLKSPVDPLTRDRLQTRMVLLGEGWEVEAGLLKPPALDVDIRRTPEWRAAGGESLCNAIALQVERRSNSSHSVF
ncbi:MAG: N-acetyltransferase [Hydrogenophaga sp.]|uniref:N-acetyltransferase n=1 Tax=Hydrogenophaga sp. TaxID=1904254 RepID=UPI002ABBBF85|nr:N-acetyltransferase [Hydrogenophaga sp.]MDZ4101533.1 N-acetyltransferase [Hydrogenophaga sp.]MDZ4282088.1 N-acetyltransferase [Hydrogenophaga sp.]